jgi:hypothetical protein
MTISRGAHALATAALLLAAVSACAGNGADPPASEPPSTADSASPPATSQATPTTNNDASELVRSFYAVRDELRMDPTVKLTKLRSVAIGGELSAQRTLFIREREQGQHQTGRTKIAELTVEGVVLDNSDPDGGRVPTVQIDVCYDVRGVDILDSNGKSVISDDRPDTGWIRYLVSNYNFEADPSGSWRVASSQNLERPPCDRA